MVIVIIHDLSSALLSLPLTVASKKKFRVSRMMSGSMVKVPLDNRREVNKLDRKWWGRDDTQAASGGRKKKEGGERTRGGLSGF
jgi:hypothetical protein